MALAICIQGKEIAHIVDQHVIGQLLSSLVEYWLSCKRIRYQSWKQPKNLANLKGGYCRYEKAWVISWKRWAGVEAARYSPTEKEPKSMQQFHNNQWMRGYNALWVAWTKRRIARILF